MSQCECLFVCWVVVCVDVGVHMCESLSLKCKYASERE